MKLESKSNCPLNGFQPCKLWECSWFIEVKGKHPQTGTDMNEWGCAMAWMPVMMIENSQQQRHTGAAVESFRNEMVKANEASQKILLETAKVKHIDNEPKYIGSNE
jgi:hypothetical protein